MIKVSLLPLLYIYSQNSGRRVFSRVEISPIQELPRTHKINKSWDFKKMQEPHEQRNRQEEKPRKHRTQQLHKSKSCAKAKSTITKGLTTVEILQKGYPESSLHQLTDSGFLPFKCQPTPLSPNAKTSGTSPTTVISKRPTTHSASSDNSRPSFVV